MGEFYSWSQTLVAHTTSHPIAARMHSWIEIRSFVYKIYWLVCVCRHESQTCLQAHTDEPKYV